MRGQIQPLTAMGSASACADATSLFGSRSIEPSSGESCTTQPVRVLPVLAVAHPLALQLARRRLHEQIAVARREPTAGNTSASRGAALVDAREQAGLSAPRPVDGELEVGAIGAGELGVEHSGRVGVDAEPVLISGRREKPDGGLVHRRRVPRIVVRLVLQAGRARLHVAVSVYGVSGAPWRDLPLSTRK